MVQQVTPETTIEVKLREQERQAKEAALEELQKERDRYQELLAKLKQQGIDTANL